ncbi:alpha/beta hydrolase family protein [Catenuloplanes japonicus]|uniref:alpha/beta hydrolase family protein n=1 Tax=Catenuloplanes japonicus TaxID=33876 RepID=UPI0006897D4B|nr:alpha/beta fold hydrolase [Catenuloplanes japonicus]
MTFSFRSGGNTLAGDLTLPAGPGPYRCVVFVEGSGPGGRDLGGWPARLAADGIASLAYDKPGSGASTGDWTAQSLPDRARETLAAVAAVRDRLPGSPVGLIGHSQGGWVAWLAAVSPLVSAVVTLSAPGVGVLAQEEHRLRHQLPPEAVPLGLSLLHAQVDRVRAGEDPAVVAADQRRWAGEPWFPLLSGTSAATIGFLARIAGHDPLPGLADVRCPMLAVYGADDTFLPVDESVSRLAGVETVVFPGADHGLRDPDGTRVPGFDALLAGWLTERLVLS